jgi:putative membrane protein
MDEQQASPERRFPPASRRTFLAEERTLLAWWRTGVATAAVALGIGGIVPHVSGLPRTRFLALGVGYGALALFFFVGGSIRSHRARRALASDDYSTLPMGVLAAISLYFSILMVLTILALF